MFGDARSGPQRVKAVLKAWAAATAAREKNAHHTHWRRNARQKFHLVGAHRVPPRPAAGGELNVGGAPPPWARRLAERLEDLAVGGPSRSRWGAVVVLHVGRRAGAEEECGRSRRPRSCGLVSAVFLEFLWLTGQPFSRSIAAHSLSPRRGHRRGCRRRRRTTRTPAASSCARCRGRSPTASKSPTTARATTAGGGTAQSAAAPTPRRRPTRRRRRRCSRSTLLERRVGHQPARRRPAGRRRRRRRQRVESAREHFDAGTRGRPTDAAAPRSRPRPPRPASSSAWRRRAARAAERSGSPARGRRTAPRPPSPA